MAKKKKRLLKGKKKPKSNNLPVVFEGKEALLPSKVDPSSPLAIYMREVGRYPLLSKEEEKELALELFDQKDKDAFTKLVQANLRFVVKIAFQYARYGAKVLDLVQEGNMGLIKAIQEFDPYKDVRLTTYAVWWIRSYMQDFLLKNWSLVRVGTTAAQKKLFYRLKKEQERLEREGISPSIKLIASNLDVPEKDVKIMQERMSGKDKSIDEPIGGSSSDEGPAPSLADRFADAGPLASSQIEDIEQKSLFAQALEEFQDELDERERDILHKRLLSEKPMTLSAIGDEYGFSKERARQIEEKIKKKLKAFLAEYYPDISMN